MENIKLGLDICIAIFGLLAALSVIFSLILGSKINYAKKIEEERLILKVAESNANSDKAKKEAAIALDNAAKINEKAKILELKVAEQKERAAIAERELIALQNKIKPRIIPEEKIKDIVSELKNITKSNIHISSSLGDGEAAPFARQFQAIFEAAGWKVDAGIGASAYTGVGVVLLTKNIKDERIKDIITIFGKADIQIYLQENLEGLDFQLFVGSKKTK